MGNRDEILRLLDIYLSNRANREEFEKLLAILSTLDDTEFREVVHEALGNDVNPPDSAFVDSRIEQLYPALLSKVRESSGEISEPAGDSEPVIHRAWWKAAVAAASVALLLWTGIKLWHDTPPQKEAAHITAKQIVAGGNRATLTLADGRKLDLSEGQQGIAVGEDIRYLDGTEVIEAQADSRAYSPDVQTLKLATPNGGQYQLSLSDGSRVWLNAASSITYPGTFGDGRREVTLQGEAYFEVVKDAARPFVVNTETQQVTVLGTSFNINAYSNENFSKTTLLTGSVRVNPRSDGVILQNERVLKPNQQGITGADGRTIAVAKVDANAVVAWKDGLFDFHGLNVNEAMKQIERWYNVRVIYKGPKPTAYLGGKMSRGVRLSTFLEFLENDFNIRSEFQANRTLLLYIPEDKKNSDL